MGPVTMPVLFDSTIVIDLLRDRAGAISAVEAYPEAAISIITWIEVLVGAKSPVEEAETRLILDTFPVLAMSAAVTEETIVLRRSHGLKLPDAIIFATARVNGLTLLTRNTKDFSAEEAGVLIPYRI